MGIVANKAKIKSSSIESGLSQLLLAAAASRAGAKPEARADAEAAAEAAADADPEAAADPQNSMTEEYGYDDYNYGAGGEYEDDYYGKIHQILEPSKST